MKVQCHKKRTESGGCNFYFDNRGTFYGQALRTLHGDPNLEVLTALQQPVPGQFRVSSVVVFEPRTMCHLLGLHFQDSNLVAVF